MAFNGVVIVLLLNWFTQAASTVPSAGRMASWRGSRWAPPCVVYAATGGGAGTAVIILLFVAAAVHTLGELSLLGGGYGLSRYDEG